MLIMPIISYSIYDSLIYVELPTTWDTSLKKTLNILKIPYLQTLT